MGNVSLCYMPIFVSAVLANNASNVRNVVRVLFSLWAKRHSTVTVKSDDAVFCPTVLDEDIVPAVLSVGSRRWTEGVFGVPAPPGIGGCTPPGGVGGPGGPAPLPELPATPRFGPAPALGVFFVGDNGKAGVPEAGCRLVGVVDPVEPPPLVVDGVGPPNTPPRDGDEPPVGLGDLALDAEPPPSLSRTNFSFASKARTSM